MSASPSVCVFKCLTLSPSPIHWDSLSLSPILLLLDYTQTSDRQTGRRVGGRTGRRCTMSFDDYHEIESIQWVYWKWIGLSQVYPQTKKPSKLCQHICSASHFNRVQSESLLWKIQPASWLMTRYYTHTLMMKIYKKSEYGGLTLQVKI